jgi:hypothetical protein
MPLQTTGSTKNSLVIMTADVVKVSIWFKTAIVA